MFWKYLFIIATALLAIIGIIAQSQSNQQSSLTLIIIFILIVLIAIADFIYSRNSNKQEIQRFNRIISEIQGINPKTVPPDKSFPGYAIGFIMKPGQIDQQRRKFLIDIGEESDLNRISVYLDRSNNLVYRIFDQEGESHLIKIPKRIHTFQLESYYHFYFDYGVTGDYSFMRMYINNKEMGKIIFEEKLNMPEKVNKENLTIGADIFGQNTSKFTIQMLFASQTTFRSKERNDLIRIFEQYLENI